MKKIWCSTYSAALLALVFSTATYAQDVVGTAVVDGKRVTLFSDQTWQYKLDVQSKSCTTVHDLLDFCNPAQEWTLNPTVIGEFKKVFKYDARRYGGIIVEAVGANDGIMMEYMRFAVLEVASAATGIDVDDIPIFETFEISIDGHKAETIVYGLKLKGVEVVYANTIFISKSYTIQSVVWGIGKDFNEAMRTAHQKFIESVKIHIEVDD